MNSPHSIERLRLSLPGLLSPLSAGALRSNYFTICLRQDERKLHQKKATIMIRPPIPPFTEQTALDKVVAAEAAWNTKDPDRVVLAYTEDSEWRNRDQFLTGRLAIRNFLTEKWRQEREYRLSKELWAFTDNRIAVRFKYEWCDADGQWWRSYGNEMWEFDASGLMRTRCASINDMRIEKADRELFDCVFEGEVQ